MLDLGCEKWVTVEIQKVCIPDQEGYNLRDARVNCFYLSIDHDSSHLTKNLHKKLEKNENTQS